jgi:hypothetical protein
VIEKALVAIWYGDTESYLAALAALDRMDATTMPMKIQAVFLERDPATQQRISRAAQILHERLIARDTDAAIIRLSQHIVEIVKEVATPGRAIGTDTASEKPVEAIVPPSANDVVPTSGPAWPVVRPRLKPARSKESAAISFPRPNNRPKRPPLVKRDRQRLLHDSPMIVLAGAVRDVVDQGNVAEFLEALRALAELKSPSERAPFHRAIKEAMAAKPPRQANVERLNRLILGVFGHFNTAGMLDRDGLDQFVPLQFAWAKLTEDIPQLQVSPLGRVAVEDMTAALTFLTGLSAGRDASPARSN